MELGRDRANQYSGLDSSLSNACGVKLNATKRQFKLTRIAASFAPAQKALSPTLDLSTIERLGEAVGKLGACP